MATTQFFSDSEEFLHGVEKGIEFANDSALESLGVSEDAQLGFVLSVTDKESEKDVKKYYNGSSFDYEESTE